MADQFDAPSSGGPDEGLEFDRWGRYLLPDVDEEGALKNLKKRAYTRATTFAKSVSDTYALEQWAGRMIVHGMSKRPDLVAMAMGTEPDDKARLQQIAEQAKEAANVKVAANMGTAFHTFTEAVDAGKAPAVPAELKPYLDAYQALMKEHRIGMFPGYIEKQVILPRFQVAGTFDRIVSFQDELVIADVKTGRDLSYGWNEIAIQEWIYANAAVIWNKITRKLEPMPVVSKTRALVFHVPLAAKDEDGNPLPPSATLYQVDLLQAGQAAQLCWDVREWRKRRNLATLLSSASAGAPVIAASWADRLKSAGSRGELSAIFQEAQRLGEWTKTLQDIGMTRLGELTTTGISG